MGDPVYNLARVTCHSALNHFLYHRISQSQTSGLPKYTSLRTQLRFVLLSSTKLIERVTVLFIHMERIIGKK